MYGKYVATGSVSGVSVVYEAFMLNEGELVVTATHDGVELERWVLPEAVTFAIADLYEREDAR
jgi:hypothetical protein